MIDKIDPMTEHRLRYPEQYEHPACGKRMRVSDEVQGTVERVVRSRFGLLVIFKEHGCEKAWLLSDCKEVV